MSAEAKDNARGENRKFAYDLGLQLKEWCEIFSDRRMNDVLIRAIYFESR